MLQSVCCDDAGAIAGAEALGTRLATGPQEGEQLMVPEAEFTSSYGKRMINRPTWEPLVIAGYFFLGGLAGASSVLAVGAQHR